MALLLAFVPPSSLKLQSGQGGPSGGSKGSSDIIPLISQEVEWAGAIPKMCYNECTINEGYKKKTHKVPGWKQQMQRNLFWS